MNLIHRLLGILALAGVLIGTPAAAAVADGAGDDTDDGSLEQTIDPNQTQGTGQVVIDRGHVDFGPTLSTGEWAIQIHDDSATPSYWRHLEDVVMKVNDTGILEVPDSPAYEFLQQEPGTAVWVVPQTQKSDVVWTGWNTQEPGVLSSLDVGTTLSVLGVDGPGDVVAYLQSGNFGDPQPLWSSFDPFPQQTWIEVNTHTHANWVFTEPGIYLVDVQFDAELNTGESVSARDTLRFAVGDATDPQPAFAMATDAAEPAPAATEQAETAAPTGQGGHEEPGGLGQILFIVVGAVVAVLVIAVIVIALAARRTRARVIAARRSKEPSV